MQNKKPAMILVACVQDTDICMKYKWMMCLTKLSLLYYNIWNIISIFSGCRITEKSVYVHYDLIIVGFLVCLFEFGKKYGLAFTGD